MGIRKEIKKIATFYKQKHLELGKSGFYKFLIKNIITIVLLIAFLTVLITVIERYIIDLDIVFAKIVDRVEPYKIFVLFGVSESLLGLIPPDLFIIWCEQFDFPYLYVSILAVLSYGGGIASYFIGKLVSRNKGIKKGLNDRYAKNVEQLRKWGGFYIIIAALFPLPFAMVCVLVGLVHFDIKKFLFYSLFRIPRFFLYAYFFFEVLNL